VDFLLSVLALGLKEGEGRVDYLSGKTRWYLVTLIILFWQGVRMPMLTELRLQSCEGINSSSMAALSHCVMLEV